MPPLCYVFVHPGTMNIYMSHETEVLHKKLSLFFNDVFYFLLYSLLNGPNPLSSFYDLLYCDLQTTAQTNTQILDYYWVSFLGFLFVLNNINTLTLFLRTVFKPFNNLPRPLSSFSHLPQTKTRSRACLLPILEYYFPAPYVLAPAPFGSCPVSIRWTFKTTQAHIHPPCESAACLALRLFTPGSERIQFLLKWHLQWSLSSGSCWIPTGLSLEQRV